MADAQRLLNSLLQTGFGGRNPSPGVPLEGPDGAGASSPDFEGLMEWFGESLTRHPPTAPAVVETEGLGGSSGGGQQESEALMMVRAMIAAAQAEGRIDAAELARIRERIASAGAGPAEQALMIREVESATPLGAAPAGTRDLDTSPLDTQAHAGLDPNRAGRLYAASLRAVNPANPSSRHYLERLAQRLHLPAAILDKIHTRLGAPRRHP
jgi:uncharacterized membrane protein YebE (DUF533 family)